jgi:hypothetical protein
VPVPLENYLSIDANSSICCSWNLHSVSVPSKDNRAEGTDIGEHNENIIQTKVLGDELSRI